MSLDEPATMVKTEAVALVKLIRGVISKQSAEKVMAAAGTPFLEIFAKWRFMKLSFGVSVASW